MSVRTVVLGLAIVSSALAPLIGCEGSKTGRGPNFPHRLHLMSKTCGEDGKPDCPTCSSCHGGIGKSEARALPAPDVCAGCHGSDSYHAKMGKKQAAERVPERKIRFDHGIHISLPEIAGQCMKCHEGVVRDGDRPTTMPSKPTCLTCHDEQFNRGECAPCHPNTDLAKRVPKTFLRHDLGFVRNHGTVAASRAKVCAQCHAETFCLDCHDTDQTLPVEVRNPESIDRSFVHRGDFVTRHAIEARSQSSTCTRCHSVATCDGCHVERGVSAARIGSTNPHPRGWIGPNTASPNFHGRAARRDIVSCASCHDHGPATNCISCHRVGGHGGNPHPSGWQSARSPRDAMCRYCHGG